MYRIHWTTLGRERDKLKNWWCPLGISEDQRESRKAASSIQLVGRSVEIRQSVKRKGYTTSGEFQQKSLGVHNEKMGRTVPL
ncbi:hypothetical protein ANCDUO_00448 [Ancylostoma duodenale]|uniref:Uncharacterized protein n=1 Tax=Ancylostoma duodenale TaxID=51022 RepID=A0A0C2HHU3_9BILA|nr:hypothetical protein ANCDUO_00448 [Ancylostoma duodenale]